jgi:hypothetical protein
MDECGKWLCNHANCGGAARVSATVTRAAPWRTHQRAIASPEAPKPKIKTDVSRIGLIGFIFIFI